MPYFGRSTAQFILFILVVVAVHVLNEMKKKRIDSFPINITCDRNNRIIKSSGNRKYTLHTSCVRSFARPSFISLALPMTSWNCLNFTAPKPVVDDWFNSQVGLLILGLKKFRRNEMQSIESMGYLARPLCDSKENNNKNGLCSQCRIRWKIKRHANFTQILISGLSYFRFSWVLLGSTCFVQCTHIEFPYNVLMCTHSKHSQHIIRFEWTQQTDTKQTHKKLRSVSWNCSIRAKAHSSTQCNCVYTYVDFLCR